jgi:NTP pyrophosphatase (non-canonical NTP hydrolase)
MNLNDHQAWALTLADRKGFNFDLHHAGDGIFTEAGELVDALKRFDVYGKAFDVVNIREEVGDAMWYVALGADTLGIPVEKLAEFRMDEPELQTYRAILMLPGVIAGQVQNTVAVIAINGNKAAIPQLVRELTGYLYALRCVAEHFGFTLEEAADSNYAKLIKRYPDKCFKAEHALNRDTDAERVALVESISGNDDAAAVSVAE